MLPRLRLVVAATCTGLVLAGCGAPGKTGTLPPEPTLTGSPDATATAVPTSATPTPDPLVSDDGSDASIRAFVTAYFAATNHAIATGQTSVIAPYCTCQNLVAGIDGLYRQGSLRGGRATVTSIDVSDNSAGVARAMVTFSESEQQLLDKQGNVVRVTPAHPQERTDLILNRQRGHWLVVGVRPLP